MTRKKLYFRNEDSEHCHDRGYFIEDMNDYGMSEITVLMAVPDKNADYFWCKAIRDACSVELDDYPCGRQCEDYKPCNGKSGKCKFKTHCYTYGEEVILKYHE